MKQKKRDEIEKILSPPPNDLKQMREQVVLREKHPDIYNVVLLRENKKLQEKCECLEQKHKDLCDALNFLVLTHQKDTQTINEIKRELLILKLLKDDNFLSPHQ